MHDRLVLQDGPYCVVLRADLSSREQPSTQPSAKQQVVNQDQQRKAVVPGLKLIQVCIQFGPG